MHSKTKIIVLHMKELVYTGIFLFLGILFLVLIVLMFSSDNKKAPSENSADMTAYVPGVYTTTLLLGQNSVDLEIVLDENNINSIKIVQLDEAVTTMYPLIEPSLESIAAQIYESQSLENITFSDDNRYTSSVLLEAIRTTIEKAVPVQETSETAVENNTLY
ncbi:MAG: hypothetical protein IJ429_02420 [Lachnospiraceae bacterium]|nr:hypothetical protein [Lachnospiraceae bacterium]